MYYEGLDWAVFRYCRDNGVTREQLSSKLGMSSLTLRRKISGEREFKLSEAVALADIIGVSLDALLQRQLDKVV